MGEPSWYLGVAIGLITMLGVLNIFFITRLVRKLETSSDSVRDLQSEVKHLSEKISMLSDVFSRLARLEKDMALIQFVMEKDIRGE